MNTHRLAAGGSAEKMVAVPDESNVHFLFSTQTVAPSIRYSNLARWQMTMSTSIVDKLVQLSVVLAFDPI